MNKQRKPLFHINEATTANHRLLCAGCRAGAFQANLAQLDQASPPPRLEDFIDQPLPEERFFIELVADSAMITYILAAHDAIPWQHRSPIATSAATATTMKPEITDEQS